VKTIKRTTLLVPIVVCALGTALQSQSPLPGGQTQPPPNINGLWKFGEAFVYIVVDNDAIHSAFLFGKKCFDGRDRSDPIGGTLSTNVVGGVTHYTITAGKLSVCTRDSGMVAACKGAIASAYEANILTAEVTHNKISGTRFAQGVRNCRPNSADDGEHDFALTRDACTDLEHRVAEQDENARRVQRVITDSSATIAEAHAAATSRYGATYTWQTHTFQTNWLLNPYFVLTAEFATPEAFYDRLQQELTGDGWQDAKLTAEFMGRDGLAEADKMAREMTMIESALRIQRDVFENLRSVRRSLAACRRANPVAQY
jgi:hypothetical protein